MFTCKHRKQTHAWAYNKRTYLGLYSRKNACKSPTLTPIKQELFSPLQLPCEPLEY